MIQTIINLGLRHRQFLTYAFIGASGALLDLCVFFILYNVFDLDKNISTFCSTTIGILNNFALNSRYNFKVSNNLAFRFAKFYCVGMLGILLTIGLFGIFVNQFNYNANLVKVASLIPVLIVQFIINKHWSFK